MKELFLLIRAWDIKGLFLDQTENGVIRFFRYCFVGGVAFVADFAAFTVVCLLFGRGAAVTVLGTVAGFLFGLTVNFLMSKRFVFTENARKVSRGGEFIWYAVIGAIGAVLNVLLMLVATQWVLAMNRYIAKLLVALIVLVYNYIARKLILYTE